MTSGGFEALGSIEPFTRRDFFRRSGLVGLLMAGGCASRGHASSGTDHHRRLNAIGTALLGIPPDAVQFDSSRVDDLVRTVFPNPEIDLTKVLKAIILAISVHPLFSRKFSRFESLDRQDQERVLQSWLDSRWELRRLLIVLVRTLCGMAHYGRPDVWPEIGYDGPWVGRIPIPHNPVRVSHGIIDGGSPSAIPADLSAHTVVIGFGAGGGVVATELAERGVEVLVCESGGYVTSDTMTQREEEMIPRLFNQFGFRQTRDRRINIIQGRAVGGSTVHNINLCYRAPEWILEEWREKSGLDVFSPAGLEPYYAAVESRIRVERIHDSMVNRNNRLAAEGAGKLGWAHEVARHNLTDCLGSGFCELGCAYDRKNNIPVAYLPGFSAAGGRIITHCKVTRIEMEGGKAGAVHAVLPNGRSIRVVCKRVIVSAGALDTPALLIQSGLAGKNAQIGRRLHLHPGTMVAGFFDEPIEGWRNIPQSVVVTEFIRPRPEGAYVVVPAFAHPMLFASMSPGSGELNRRVMSGYANIAALSPFIHDRTEGVVAAGSSGEPKISYALSPADLETLRDSWKVGAQTLFEAGAKEVLLPPPRGVILKRRDDMRLIDGIDMTESPYGSVHPQCTCAMGRDPSRGAVDENGKLFGYQGIYVCDTSLYPDSIGVPPQLTAMALGRRLGEHLALMN